MQGSPTISLGQVLFALLPVALLILGGIAVRVKRMGPGLQSIILHFAAGVVFSVVAVELLPDMIRIHDPYAIIIGFVLGIATMLLAKKYTSGLKQEVGKMGLPWGILVAVGIDLLLDGLLLGTGFAAGKKEGVLLALALSTECLSLGLALGGTLVGVGTKMPKLVVVMCLLGALLLFGAATGFFVLQYTGERTLEVLLSFGSAALLFLVTEELLVEAHHQKDTPVYTSAFFTGFLLFIVMGMFI
ncbi:transporter [Pedobacter sp. Du54]|uniref:ZIP family metal transporter n=1 Tax=Pedobacter anseongensis TaxID=3133439 RepID=UPI0030979099